MITDPNSIIDALGGTTATARLFEIEPPSVSDWRRYGIPKARLMYLKVAKPELFASTVNENKNSPFSMGHSSAATRATPAIVSGEADGVARQLCSAFVHSTTLDGSMRND